MPPPDGATTPDADVTPNPADAIVVGAIAAAAVPNPTLVAAGVLPKPTAAAPVSSAPNIPIDGTTGVVAAPKPIVFVSEAGVLPKEVTAVEVDNEKVAAAVLPLLFGPPGP